jgi:3-phytase
MRVLVGSLASAALLAACATAPAPLADVARPVPAVRETAPVDTAGDAADDPAIWVAPEAAQSLVIATQKQGGLYVFDLSGAIVQTIPGGRPNNVDLRADFPWSDGAGPIVAASDRTDNAIPIWRFDAAARRLRETPIARVPTPFAEVYGFCLGRHGADTIAVVTSKIGQVAIWTLAPDAQGGVAARPRALFDLSPIGVRGIAEGCVVDDAAGVLYVAQELVGIWRVPLDEPTGRTLIDRVGAGRLVADVEGLTLYVQPDGGGYLIASVQGANRFAVYDRAGANAYRGSFEVTASRDGAADAVSGTDGIDIVSAPLGPDFPQGLLVVQDDENTAPAALQNFKYVSWADIAAALGL